jgi:uncharacterized protein (DUF3084 family)
MSAQADLLQLYQDWRSLTEQEREAIEEGDWRRVHKCQSAKSELQPRIVRQTQETHDEWNRFGVDRSQLEKQVRSVVNELIYLETLNGEFIAEQRRRAQAEFDQLNQSSRKLGKVQKSYTPNAPFAWESYS